MSAQQHCPFESKAKICRVRCRTSNSSFSTFWVSLAFLPVGCLALGGCRTNRLCQRMKESSRLPRPAEFDPQAIDVTSSYHGG